MNLLLPRRTVEPNVVERLHAAGYGGHPLALVLGSGLKLAAPFVLQQSIPYRDIPGFPTTSVAGHKGAFSVWELPGRGSFLVMEGRPHLYEGWTMDELAIPVRLLHALGARTYVVTNAAGGLDPAYQVGDLVAIADHLSFLPPTLTWPTGTDYARWQSLRGQVPYHQPSIDALGACWPAEQGPLRRGVYAAVLGPNYETPAEVRLFRRLGADLIGMSTATEVLIAASLGMRVLGLSLVSNLLPATGTLTHDEVKAAGIAGAARLITGLAAGWDVVYGHSPA